MTFTAGLLADLQTSSLCYSAPKCWHCACQGRLASSCVNGTNSSTHTSLRWPALARRQQPRAYRRRPAATWTCCTASTQEAYVQQPAAGLGRRRLLATPLLTAAVTGLLSHASPASAALVDEQAATSVFSSTAQSVVSIADFKVDKDGEETAEGTGSGFTWDTRGHIVTNYHCVAKLAADRRGTQVTMVGLIDDAGNMTQYKAAIKGLDPNRDIAVLRIDAPASLLRPVKLGTSADLRVGQAVFAIGNPLGFSRTLTSGVVSGLDRIIPSPAGTRNYGAIQTDAAISSGNSGGPLLDSAGRLVGINTATFTRAGTGRSSGVNFALPVDMLREVVPRLIVYGNAAGKT